MALPSRVLVLLGCQLWLRLGPASGPEGLFAG